MYIHTFNSGFKMRILVQFVHLSPPVKIIPPVGNNLLQVSGVEAVVKLAVLQRRDRPCPINTMMQVLKMTGQIIIKATTIQGHGRHDVNFIDCSFC